MRCHGDVVMVMFEAGMYQNISFEVTRAVGFKQLGISC